MKLSRYCAIAGVLVALATGACFAEEGFDATQPFGYCLFGEQPTGYFQGKALKQPATAALMAIHPDNPLLRVAVFAQDQSSVDFANPFAKGETNGPQLAFSQDGGNTWNLVEAPLAGNFESYTVRAVSYSREDGPDGTVLLQGDYCDAQALSGIFTSFSKDGGKSWSSPKVIAKGEALLSRTSQGISLDASDTLFDPNSPNIAYQLYSSTSNPTTFFGDIYFSSSQDLGKSWGRPQKIYGVAHDLYTKFNSLGAGQCVAPTLAAVQSDGQKVLLSAFLRIYPDNNNCYSQNIRGPKSGINPNGERCAGNEPNSIFDRVLVRSVDGGVKWDKHATFIAPGEFSRFAPTFDPRNERAPSIHPLDSSLGTFLAVDQMSSRIYAVWQAGHNNGNRRVVSLPQIWLSMSNDSGQSWTKPMVVSQTSKALKSATTAADQAFGPRVFVKADGTVAVTYYDFRNFKGGWGVPTDAWQAEFRLNKAGNSLELIKETRLTPKSFNSAPAFGKFVVTKTN